MTPVIFRHWKVSNDVIALFPNELADHRGNILSYEHVGQHGSADYWWIISKSRPATPTEYASLKAELESVGYDDLRVLKRRPAR